MSSYIDKIKLTNSETTYNIQDAVRTTDTTFTIQKNATVGGNLTCAGTITSANIAIDANGLTIKPSATSSNGLIISATSTSIGSGNDFNEKSNAILIGHNLYAYNNNHIAIGQFNETGHDGQVLFEIGDGSDEANRCSSLIIKKTNNIYHINIRNCLDVQASTTNAKYILQYENQQGVLKISTNGTNPISKFQYNAFKNTFLLGTGLSLPSQTDQTVFGRYNQPMTSLLFSIGNGTTTKQSNIVEVSSSALKVNGLIDCVSPTLTTENNVFSSPLGVRRIMIGNKAPGASMPAGVKNGDIYMWIASTRTQTTSEGQETI